MAEVEIWRCIGYTSMDDARVKFKNYEAKSCS